MIRFEKINEDNFDKVINIKMPENQHFVATNVYSIAQAWLRYETARPYAIYNDEEVIGFIMLNLFDNQRRAGIWRLMIALDKQGMGYGRQAMNLAINMIKESKKYDHIYLYVSLDNVIAKKLYTSLGFEETGIIEDDDEILKLYL